MADAVIIPTNEYQTPVTRELLDLYPDEVQEQFLEFVDTVPLIKYMIGTDGKGRRRYSASAHP